MSKEYEAHLGYWIVNGPVDVDDTSTVTVSFTPDGAFRIETEEAVIDVLPEMDS